ncbi:beta-hydroxylase [Corynebacterium phocae]|uniref:Carbonic anhydrase n=1 Tax=Corynebacterium phocae TaxID=161895 RepID=A0A1L7D1G7_9CORY|nr:carbonic anhydrase [Corynebacterium phocae]APT91903.1 beta-hydroxylase [Corynebacterium phocae]KAA8727404.1 carbonic anhydrase [Corynebacterium phocae]
MSKETPQQIWENLIAGNRRYAADESNYPNSDIAHRVQLLSGQSPKMVIFGCGDARVPSEFVFDLGLGDAFIVRNAGHVIDATVLASIQFAIDDLGCNLLVVMGHQNCGAVKAALGFLEKDSTIPTGLQRTIVEKVSMAAVAARAEGLERQSDVERRNIEDTVDQFMERIPHLLEKIEDGSLGIAGIYYSLDSGLVDPVILHGVS